MQQVFIQIHPYGTCICSISRCSPKLSGTLANTFVAGDKVTGSVSGATAIVHHTESSNLFVHDVQGAFIATENISAAGSGSTATLTNIAAPRTYTLTVQGQLLRNQILLIEKSLQQTLA